MHLYVDGAFASALNANAERPDVGAVYPTYGPAHRFDLTLPAARGQHRVCAYGINVGAGSTNTELGCITVNQGGIPNAPAIYVYWSGYYWRFEMGGQVKDNSPDEDGFVIERSDGGSAGPWNTVYGTLRRRGDGSSGSMAATSPAVCCIATAHVRSILSFSSFIHCMQSRSPAPASQTHKS